MSDWIVAGFERMIWKLVIFSAICGAILLATFYGIYVGALWMIHHVRFQ